MGLNQDFLDKDLRFIVKDIGLGWVLLRHGEREFEALFDKSPDYYDELGARIVAGGPQIVCLPADAQDIKKGAKLEVVDTQRNITEVYYVAVAATDKWGAATLQLTKDKMSYEAK